MSDDDLQRALELTYAQLEREHGHSSAWPDDTWPACPAAHDAMRAARAALAARPEPGAEGLREALRAALADHADIRLPDGRLVIEWERAAEVALAAAPPAPAPLDVERLARALSTDAVRRYVLEAWVESGVSEPGYATPREMAEAIVSEYAAPEQPE